jgi:hypothetical protein
MTTNPAPAPYVPTCTACDTALAEHEEILCPRCKYPKLAAVLDRVDEILFNENMTRFFEMLETVILARARRGAGGNLDSLHPFEMAMLLRTRADFALLHEFCTAVLEATDAAAAQPLTDGVDIRALQGVTRSLLAAQGN